MSTTNTPYLCGGTLFTLILQARKQRTKARNRYGGGSDGLKDTDVMKGLLEVVTGENYDNVNEKTFSKNTTLFKTCMDYGTTYIPFKEDTFLTNFNQLINSDICTIEKRMEKFIDRFIDKEKAQVLVKAIFEVLKNDDKIPGDTSFIISSTKKVTKEDILSVQVVKLPLFLLSILDFILNNRKDNTKGRDTFKVWHSQGTPHSPWKYIGNVGNTISHDIKVITVQDDVTLTEQANDKIEEITDIDDISLVEQESNNSKAKPTEKPRLEVEILNEEDTSYLEEIKTQAGPILEYCINQDPSAEETDLTLSTQLETFVQHWYLKAYMINDSALRTLLNDIIAVFTDYLQYISSQFLRPLPSGDALLYKNQSYEEGENLRNILRPETLRIRNEMVPIFKRLYSHPED